MEVRVLLARLELDQLLTHDYGPKPDHPSNRHMQLFLKVATTGYNYFCFEELPEISLLGFGFVSPSLLRV